MKYFNFFLFTFLTAYLSSSLYGQTDDWTVKHSKDDKIEVRYNLGSRIDKSGEEVQLMEYTATTIIDVQLDQCEQTMRNVALHKEFMDNTEESEEVETQSESEWLAYYFFEPPWPMPENDCIMKTSLSKSEDGKYIVFKGVSFPDLIERKGVKRLEYYEYEYSFMENEDKTVEFSLAVRLTPVGSAPNWMVKTWFPKGPIEFIEKFVKVASE